MNISVVIPLYNEEESLQELFLWIKKVADAHQYVYEVIFIDDGSTDQSWQVVESLAAKHPEVKGIKFRRNYGKSPALYCGFDYLFTIGFQTTIKIVQFYTRYFSGSCIEQFAGQVFGKNRVIAFLFPTRNQIITLVYNHVV